MNKLIVIDDILSGEMVEHSFECVVTKLKELYPTFPQTGKLYKKSVSVENDITPSNDSTFEDLLQVNEDIFLVIYPAKDIIKIATFNYFGLGYVLDYLTPKLPSIGSFNGQTPSPNNALSARSNQPRVLGRIPDIFGTVRSTPDLISSSYSVFVNNQEAEYSDLCIGKGSYVVSDFKDDTTPLSSILGSSVQVYAPFTSANTVGVVPQLVIGTPTTRPIVSSKKLNSVNGQTLRAPNYKNIKANNNIQFESPNKIKTTAFDFSSYFITGDQLSISDASVLSSNVTETKSVTVGTDFSISWDLASPAIPPQYIVGGNIQLTGALYTTVVSGNVTAIYLLDGTFNISSVTLVGTLVGGGVGNSIKIVLNHPELITPAWGTIPSGLTPVSVSVTAFGGSTLYGFAGVYTISSVSTTEIQLVSPSVTNPAWGNLVVGTPFVNSGILQVTSPRWVGPFLTNVPDTKELIFNFVGLNGLFAQDNDGNLTGFDVAVEVEITPTDALGSPIGVPELFTATVTGQSSKLACGHTLFANPTFTGYSSIRVRRTTDSNLTFKGTIVDTLQWRDLYIASPVPLTNFGNVTTIQAMTLATASALSLKARKLNCLVTRKIPTINPDGSINYTLTASNRFSDIIVAIALDPHIGNRQASEINTLGIYNIRQEIEDYFGTPLATFFGYTLDSTNASFEEIITDICSSVFCTPYRNANVLNIFFERQTADSVLLFNHRNRIPSSETRTRNFGITNNYDGVEVQWVDGNDNDAPRTYYVPSGSATANAIKVQKTGVRNIIQAHLLAWRVWNKLQYQNTTVELKATQESDILILQNRILIADNTRPDTQDGEIVNQVGLVLQTSQPVNFIIGHNYDIFLQLPDATVDSIQVFAGADEYHVILARAPLTSLALDDGLYAKTLYMIVNSLDLPNKAFLVSQKQWNEDKTNTVTAVNYSDNYYANDTDHIDGFI